MRALFLALLLLSSFRAAAEIRAMAQATKDGMVGVWEAVVQDQSMATGVYQMVIPKEGDAYLIHLFASGAGAYSMFFGRAAAIELADGNIKIRFTMAPEHIQYCDWVEIQGYAVAEADTGAITGKIVKHRKSGPAHEWSEPVSFKKGRWIQDLERVSNEANRILRDPAFKEGRAVRKESVESQ
jgi:hypothetical protein